MPLHPEAEKRLIYSRRNHDLYIELRNDGRYLDWAATVLFYSALLLVDAHAVEVGKKPVSPAGDIEMFGDFAVTGHKLRHDYVRTSLATIRRNYTRLYNLSLDARYRQFVPTLSQLNLHEGDWETIRATVSRSRLKW